MFISVFSTLVCLLLCLVMCVMFRVSSVFRLSSLDVYVCVSVYWGFPILVCLRS